MAFVPVAGVVPSPKSNVYPVIAPEPAFDPEPSTVTLSEALPALGVTVTAAVGPTRAGATCCVAVLVRPAASVTVTVTVKEPAAV